MTCLQNLQVNRRTVLAAALPTAYVRGNTEADIGAHETRTFKSGNSEAVRLPKGLGFGIGAQVRVERRGDMLMIRAVEDPEDARRELRRLFTDLQAIGAPSDGVQAREPFEFPDRPGL